MQTALRGTNPGTYQGPSTRPPNDWIYPAGESWPFTQPVFPEAVARVDAIRSEAMACGWSEARLYQNRGRVRYPCGKDYGLVCYVDEDREIGEVDERFIEVIHGAKTSRPSTLRLYNPDVL